MRNAMEWSNLGVRYDRTELDPQKIPKDVKHAITDWRKSFKECFFLFGKPGCGKTQILAGLYKAFRKTQPNMTIECNTINGYLGNLQQAIGGIPGGTPELLKRWQLRDLIIIDDFGREKISDWRVEQMLELIDGRLRNEKTIIISSNLSLEEIQQHFGERMSSRLGSGYIVKHNGPDLRI